MGAHTHRNQRREISMKKILNMVVLILLLIYQYIIKFYISIAILYIYIYVYFSSIEGLWGKCEIWQY